MNRNNFKTIIGNINEKNTVIYETYLENVFFIRLLRHL